MKKSHRNASVSCIAAAATAAFLAIPTGCSNKGTDTGTTKGATQFPAGRAPTPEELQKALEHQKKLRPAGAPGGPAKPAGASGETPSAK